MKLGPLFMLGGAIALAGCSSQASGRTAATPSPTSTAKPVTSATVNPSPVTGASVAANTPHTGISAGSAYDKAQTYLRQGKYAAAQSQFKLAIAQRQHTARAYAGLGATDLSLRHYMEAYRAFKSAAAQEPKNAAFLYNAAYAGLFAPDFHGSVAYASRFIKLQPKNVAGYHLLLLAHGRLLDHKSQVKDARMILRLQPGNPEAHNDLGIAYTNDKKPKAAVAQYTEAIRLSPNTASYYTNRAIAEVVMQQPKPALADLEKARSLTKDPRAQKQLDPEIAMLKKMTHG